LLQLLLWCCCVLLLLVTHSPLQLLPQCTALLLQWWALLSPPAQPCLALSPSGLTLPSAPCCRNLDFNDFSGTLPPEWSALRSLVDL
jgi:hypothetical protein